MHASEGSSPDIAPRIAGGPARALQITAPNTNNSGSHFWIDVGLADYPRVYDRKEGEKTRRVTVTHKEKRTYLSAEIWVEGSGESRRRARLYREAPREAEIEAVRRHERCVEHADKRTCHLCWVDEDPMRVFMQMSAGGTRGQVDRFRRALVVAHEPGGRACVSGASPEEAVGDLRHLTPFRFIRRNVVLSAGTITG